MTLEQILARLAEIRTMLDDPSANIDIDALTNEANGLIAQRDAIQNAETRRRELRDRVAAGAGTVARAAGTMGGQPQQTEARGADSAEYRRAFLLNLRGQGDQMTHEERAAFTHTTANTTAPIPTTMLNQIWDLVTGEHSIMGDITIYRTGTVLEVVKHTAITQGAAKSVAEGVANDDEQNTMIKVTLSGKDFAKTVKIGYAMATMSLDAFEQYLIREIADGLGEAMAADAISTITSEINSGNKVTTATSGTVTFKEVATLFGKLKRAKNLCLYATRSTIYTHLVGMVDTSGKPIFQPTAQAGAEGTILGASIRVEDAVAEGKMLVGDPKKFLYNMIQDILVESDRDIETHKIIHSGYARGQGALIDDKAFAELTVKS